MKKVLVLFDGEHFALSALDFANQLNQSERILLTALFLPPIDYTDTLMLYAGGMAGPLYLPTVITDPDAVKKNEERFKEYCVRNGIEHRVHDEVYRSIPKVIATESRYADLMLMTGDTFYVNLGEETQQEYTEDAIRKAGCPVVVLPAHNTEPQNLVIAYDGSPASVYALKQFTYLLPQLCKLPAMVVYASTKDDEIPDIDYMKELCGRHFTDLSFYKLQADAKRYFNTWVTDRGKAMVIAGSYATSRLFRKQFVDELIKDHKLPVFIAHP